MPKVSIPKYSFHKPTGQARVRIDGRDVWLGRHGTPDSFQKYQDAIANWQLQHAEIQVKDVTLGQLAILYLKHAGQHYRKAGKLTSEFSSIKISLRHLLKLFRKELAAEFTCRKLKAVRQCMIDAGWVRTSINRNVGRIIRMFKWAGAEELVPPRVYHDLKLLSGLQHGRTAAKEGEPVLPVPDAFIDAVKPFVTPTVWAMIQFQRYTGCRPGEVISLRGCDLNTTGAIWEYRPAGHKTLHHGKQRVVMIGPNAQEVLRPFLTTDIEACVFSPQEGRAAFVSRNYRAGAKPAVRNARTGYSIHGYSAAVARASKKAGIPPWSPNRLRHSFATLARREFGIEAARVTLGHSSAVTSEIYAEIDLESARAVVAKIG